MSSIDILRDALFGNPPSPVFKPSREGVLAAFTRLKLTTEAGIAAAALSGTNLTAAMALVAPLLQSSLAAQAALEAALQAIPVSVAAQLRSAIDTATQEANAARDEAVDSRDTAQLAAQTAVAAGRYFPSRSTGEAGSATDQLFATDDGAGVLIYYRRTAGGSVEIGRAVTPASLAAPGTAAGIGTQLALPNAVARDLAERGTDAISVMDFIPGKALRNAIIGRTVNNNIEQARQLAGYIQNGIDAAAAQRRRLEYPAGLYNVAPREGFNAEGGVCNRVFAIRSHMDLYGEAGATLRIVDGVSTDAAPVFMCMFGTNEQLNNVSWRGLDMDMNGGVYVNGNLILKNPTSPNRASGVYSLINQAQIFVSGTPGGQAACIDHAVVERCKFRNTPGVSCLVMAQSNVFDVRLGFDWKVTDCEVINVGLDTNDHSAFYAWADEVVATRNTFRNDYQFTTTGGLVAFEVHGSGTHFTGNLVENFYQGMWIDGNFTTPVKGTLIDGNRFINMGAFGILYFGVSPAIAPATQTVISNNIIEFDDLPQTGITQKIGIGTTGNYSQVDGLISNNRISSAGTTTASAGVSFAAGTVAGQKHDKMIITGNVVERTTFGVTLSTNNAAGLGSFWIISNTFLQLTPAGVFGFPIGIAVNSGATSVVDRLTLVDNECIDDRTSGPRCAFGIRLEAKITYLENSGNRAAGMTSADYAEVAAEIPFRVDTKFMGIDTTGVKVNGQQVLAGRGAAVADAATDADVRAQLNLLLARMRSHGLIAS